MVHTTRKNPYTQAFPRSVRGPLPTLVGLLRKSCHHVGCSLSRRILFPKNLEQFDGAQEVWAVRECYLIILGHAEQKGVGKSDQMRGCCWLTVAQEVAMSESCHVFDGIDTELYKLRSAFGVIWTSRRLAQDEDPSDRKRKSDSDCKSGQVVAGQRCQSTGQSICNLAR